MKYLMPAFRLKIFMIVLLGLIYPLAMTGISQVLFPQQAGGDFVIRDGTPVGSRLIGQNFEKPEYFWPRPSAINYNPQPSGGSNLGQASTALKAAFIERKAKIKTAHPDQSLEPPQELLFASGSGLDPHISPEAAKYQMRRVALARQMNIESVQKIIDSLIEKRQLGILGESVVNVLALNLALDQAQK